MAKNKDKTKLVTCMTCKFSQILLCGANDPAIAKCLKKYDAFWGDYVRDVANAERICPLWEIFVGKRKFVNIR